METETNKSILIIKISGIGDVIMALPMLSHIGDRDKITWIVGESAQDLIRAIPKVSKVIVVDERKLLFGSFWQKIKEVFKVYKKIGGRAFDLIIIGHLDPRYRWFTLLSFWKKRRFFMRDPVQEKQYQAFAYLELLGKKDLKLHWPLISIPCLTIQCDILLAPGGNPLIQRGKNLRSWPISYYGILAKQLIDKGYSVGIIGSKEDVWTLPHFHPLPIQDFCGKYSLIESLALIKNAKALVTHDSGPMHMGILAQIKVFAIFGPTHPLCFIPDQPDIHIFWKGNTLACSPCNKGKYYGRCQDPLCVKSISPDEVFSYMEQIL